MKPEGWIRVNLEMSTLGFCKKKKKPFTLKALF